MSANKQVVRGFYARAINGRVPSDCDVLLTEDFVHNGDPRGQAGQRLVVEAFLAAFSPLHHEILLMLGEDDLVCARQRWSGTHVGEFLGRLGTGREVEFTSTAILRLRDGRIAEAWDEIGLAALIEQLSGS